jgi:hypothetical protein
MKEYYSLYEVKLSYIENGLFLNNTFEVYCLKKDIINNVLDHFETYYNPDAIYKGYTYKLVVHTDTII